MRGRWLVVCAFVGLLVLGVGRAIAAPEPEGAKPHSTTPHLGEKEPAGDHDKKADHAAKASHEPTLFDGALDQTIWTVVVFLLLLILLRLFAWNPMLEGLKKRETDLQEKADQAKRDRDEAARLKQELDLKLSQAADQVRQMIDEARRDAQQMHDQMMAQARAEIQDEKDRLRREIETARDQALQDLMNRTAELAASVSSLAIRRNMTADDHRRLVDDAIAGLGEAGAAWRRQRTTATT